MVTWVYRQTDRGVWTVGYYTPDGIWVPESDWGSPELAAQRVHYLNGEVDIEALIGKIKAILDNPCRSCGYCFYVVETERKLRCQLNKMRKDVAEVLRNYPR